MLRLLKDPFVPVVLYALGSSAIFSAYMVKGISLSQLALQLQAAGWILILLMWVESDSRCRRQVPCYDFPFLIGLFIHVALPWYCLWSRRARGLLLVLAVVGLWLLPYFAAALAAAVMSRPPFVLG